MYKKSQGMISRAGVAVLSLLIAFYASYCWFWWMYDSNAASMVEMLTSISFIGAVVIFLGVGAGGVYISFVAPKSSDYLIDMDIELKKVVWPAVQPLFDYKAEAWGSTYVVIVCTVLLTVYIWIVDMGLELTLTKGLLQWLFSKGA